MAWASDQTWGGCSHRSAIYAIANHANDNWFCWAKHQTLADESEQSVDSVGRRIQEFVNGGMVRRVKLKRHGRRTHDFLILKPSPYFDAPLEVIEQFIPRGCDIMDEGDAAANCGSAAGDENAVPQRDSEINATAACGSAETLTLPQPAVDATALVREPIEPLSEPEDSPHAPHGGQAVADAEKEIEGWQDFKSAFEADKVPIARPSIAAKEFDALKREDRKLVTQAARGLIAHRSRERRPSGKPSAQTFIRERDAWPGWIKLAPTDPVALVFVPEDSREYAAVSSLCRIGGKQPPMVRYDERQQRRGYWRHAKVPADLLALAEFAHVPDADWHVVEDKTDEFYAWARRISEWTGARTEAQVVMLDGFTEIEIRPGHTMRAQKRTSGLRVPSRWPPRKDGTFGSDANDTAA
ncbi:hypothetical protein CAK95_24460 [Pseudorhodoplanes sinuspersici]|uniref:DnaA N-terminal domain-containing protein n=2 Tax=Pseudorhodoplanes sinuspersici TaxID=1235591 RepID=A0A1W6ZWX5_9HYPH|nr:hypothetical protein CAK95_24460 [Pseudorhodoplanes sinuspersici]